MPVLIPIADTLGPVLTGILTGLVTAVTLYNIDRLFDWFSATGTELLEAQLAKAYADAELVQRLSSFIELQYSQSRHYASASAANAQLLALLGDSVGISGDAAHAQEAYEVRAALTGSLPAAAASLKGTDDELDRLLAGYQEVKGL